MFLFRHNWPAKIEKKSESRALRPKKNVPNDGTNSGFGCRRPILAAVSGPSTKLLVIKAFGQLFIGNLWIRLLPLVPDHRTVAGAS